MHEPVKRMFNLLLIGYFLIIICQFHFILECKSLENLRKNYLCKYYYQNPNIIKFNKLMSTHKKKMLEKLCFFIVKIYDAVCTPNP